LVVLGRFLPKNQFNMKRPLLFAFLFCFAIQAFSQACVVSTDTAHLDVNNARVILQASGDFFWDRSDAGFLTPINEPNLPQTASIFAGGIWVAGFDGGVNLKLAAQTYGASGGNTDFYPGPLDDNGITSNSACANFDKLWKVGRNDVSNHIADFTSDGGIDGPVPQSILRWPGRNNPHSLDANGFELPVDQDLAPFVDLNGNGNYEPLLGEYPRFFGDQAIWWVFNDQGGGAVHGETNGNALQVEIHALAYAFEGQGDTDLENTSFYEFQVYNKAAEKLDSAYIGLWLDPDIGCPSDDYVGCISSEKIAFAYNSDALDGDVGCNCSTFGVNTYCENIPVTAIKVMKGPIGTNGGDVGFSSFTFASNPVGGATPWWGLSPYYSLSGKWPDGVPITYGGNGYDTLSTNYHPFLMDGNPGNSDDWSLCSENLLPSDFRMLIGSGPFDLNPGQSTSVTYAVLNNFDVTHPCPNLQPLIEMSDEIETIFGQLSSSENPISSQSHTQFYPNPLVSEGKLSSNGVKIEAVRLFNTNGQLVRYYHDLKTNELTISSGGLPAGLYYYAALLGNGLLATGKIAIQ
jgi:hypothetical protein